jgi:hypothetical protein
MKNPASALLGISLCWTLFAATASADDGPYYRVEVIVLQHASGQSDARQIDQLDSFAALIDPVRQVQLAAWEAERALHETESDPDDVIEPQDEFERAEQEARRQASEVVDLFSTMESLEAGTEAEEIELDPGPVYPDPFLQLETLSPAMQRAWDRLAASGEFRPLAWRAWHQPLSRNRLSPQVRIHDEVPLRLEWSGLMIPGLPGAGHGWQTEQLMPKADYRLDGSLRLRQRQFMHVELDLVWREPVDVDEFYAGPLALDELPESGFRQHRLTQSRTVRAGRLEYFDSSWLAVLVLVERWEPDEDS